MIYRYRLQAGDYDTPIDELYASLKAARRAAGEHYALRPVLLVHVAHAEWIVLFSAYDYPRATITAVPGPYRLEPAP